MFWVFNRAYRIYCAVFLLLGFRVQEDLAELFCSIVGPLNRFAALVVGTLTQ